MTADDWREIGAMLAALALALICAAIGATLVMGLAFFIGR